MKNPCCEYYAEHDLDCPQHSKRSIIQYDKVTLEVLAQCQSADIRTFEEAEKAWYELSAPMKFSSYDVELVARTMFMNGFWLGRHGERME